MPTETVTLVLDKSQYERAISEVVAGQGRLSRSGASIGDGFLRGERVFRTATRNVVQGLATANSAADATLLTLVSLERVFRIPIAATVLAAGGFALLEVISKTLDKARLLRQEIDRLTSLSKVGSADFLGTDQINKNLADTTAKINEITKDSQELRAGKGKFLGLDLMGSETRANFLLENEKKLTELRAQGFDDVSKLTSKQNDLNEIEQKRLDGAEDQADLDKLEIDHKERLGKLADDAAAAGLAGTEAAQQLLSVENDRFNIARQILKTKQDEANLAKSIKTAATTRDFFADVGSGRFAKNFAADQRKDFEAQAGKDFVEKIRAGQEKGFFKDPLSQAILKDAEKLAKQEKTGLPALLNADFTNLLDLSRYDFSGLLPLSGLTLQIQ